MTDRFIKNRLSRLGWPVLFLLDTYHKLLYYKRVCSVAAHGMFFLYGAACGIAVWEIDDEKAFA